MSFLLVPLKVTKSFVIRFEILGSNIMNNRSISRSGCCLSEKKLSMAEKRKRRANKRLPLPKPATDSPATDLLPSGLDFKSKRPPTYNSAGAVVASQEDAQNGGGEATLTKAQRLLQSQRESVAMLTAVRECVEALPADEIKAALAEQGYYCCDDFLKDDLILDQLSAEGVALLQMMTQDFVANLGSGEYVCSLQGGGDQYVVSPRSVEWVVSVTKHLAAHLKMSESLSATNCIASMRTFDRKALAASLALLTGESNITEAVNASAQRPFGTIVNDVETDLRRLSLVYYLVDAAWDAAVSGGSDGGGGMSFQSSEEIVHPKRDRLVLFQSNSCIFQKQVWRGREDAPFASCIELHLLVKNSDKA